MSLQADCEVGDFFFLSSFLVFHNSFFYFFFFFFFVPSLCSVLQDVLTNFFIHYHVNAEVSFGNIDTMNE